MPKFIYKLPENLGQDPAANLTFFLLENTGSPLGRWRGRLPAADQRKLMGKFLGKGVLVINGADETVNHTIKCCFGQDWETTTQTWAAFGLQIGAGV